MNLNPKTKALFILLFPQPDQSSFFRLNTVRETNIDGETIYYGVFQLIRDLSEYPFPDDPMAVDENDLIFVISFL